MGGDHAPDAVLDGALLSIERGHATAAQIILTGDAAVIRAELERRGQPADLFEIVDAPDVLDAGASPVEALRKKPRNSVAVGVGTVRDKQAQAFISAGNTGLVVATATLTLECLEGIRRPGIAATIQGEQHPFTVIDVGANPQPKAMHLLHYAIMGSAYCHDTFGTQRPRVGLLNIGTEDRKGNPLVVEASQLLKQSKSNFEFVGNVEGVDVFQGACDVVVSDGFAGNVLLKVSEGVAEYMLRSFATHMAEEKIAEDCQRRILGKVQRQVDYSEYGGALLLGVDGIVTICHGRSRGPAICNAIRFALKAVGAHVNKHIVQAAQSAAATT